MTRDEAKGMLPIVKAYAEGKVIETFDCVYGWLEEENIKFDLNPEFYRIKSKPKYRPFISQDECWKEMHNHSDFGWIKCKNTNRLYNISSIYEDKHGVKIVTDDFLATSSELFDNFVFTDGTSFGILEK